MISSRIVRAALILCGAASLAAAQDPSRDYLTIGTTHFRVSFTKPLESVARRVAAHAERAYGQLSADLHPPRGIIDILVTDDFDFSNGSATTFPTNRIVVYAMPPVNDFGLRYTTDWAQMVVTHELAHVFHLDRSRGLWRIGQYVFGRSPFLFPNFYQPSWLIEGLAVYEESKHAGQGRIEGPEHHLLLRAAALDRFPSIGDASLALPRFPQGTSAYGYGSLFLHYLARTRGDSSIREFVESSSAQLVPYLIDIPARSAFGTGFGRAWAEWRDSVEQTLGDSARAATSEWRRVTASYLAAGFPRWRDSSVLTFTGATGRDVLSAYRVTTTGELTRTGTRNGLSPSVTLPTGEVLFAQPEYIGPYTYRSDLWIQRPNESPRRLTQGQRLFTPDVRADGAIVAMRTLEGATQLVRVGADGAVTAITRPHLDTLFSEPRWSRDGSRIVASRWIRGGIAQVVIVDSTGDNPRVIASSTREVVASPSWGPDDRHIVFSTGRNLHRVDVETGRIARIGGGGTTGLFEPEVLNEGVAAAFTLDSRGYGLALGGSSAEDAGGHAFYDTMPDRRLPTLIVDSSVARKYSALRQLRPRYWVPLAEPGFSGGYLLGGYTEAWDILRRHYVYAGLLVPTNNGKFEWSLEHRYRGFGLPVITTAIRQDWSLGPVFSRTSPRQVVGELWRRTTDAEVLSTFVRQRVRSSLSFSVGAGVERRDYETDPPSLHAQVDTGGIFQTANFPRIIASASYARYLTPAFAISPEDGFSVSVTARERLRSAANASGGPSTSVVSALALFKSLDLPGYAHHVLALRGSVGWADTRTNTHFEVGGTSGGTYQVFPGYTVGEGRRTFPVRGFGVGSAQGIRAATASVEYRAPLSMTHRSISTLPTFLQRSAISLFGDYGIAWCPNTLATRQVCFDPSREVKTDVASAGAELSINAGLLSWDAPTRLRVGFAVPFHNGSTLGARTVTPYFATGISF